MPTQNQIDQWQRDRTSGELEKYYQEALTLQYDAIAKERPDLVEKWENADDFIAHNQAAINETKLSVIKQTARIVEDTAWRNYDDKSELLNKIASNAAVGIGRGIKIDAALKEAMFAALDPSRGYTRAVLSSTGSFLTQQKELQKQQSDLAESVTNALNEEDVLAFSEQCFLMSQIFDIVEAKTYGDDAGEDDIATLKFVEEHGPSKRIPDVEGVDNATLLLTGSPYNFMNKLTQNADYANFFDISVADLSTLQPSIRLYKIIQNEDGEEQEHEIHFDSHYTKNDLNDFLGDKNKRGHGVGIKDFTFSYEGTDFYSVKKAIKAKLVIIANNFDELLKDRTTTYIQSDGTPINIDYKYVDLALKTGNTTTAEFYDNLNVKSDSVFNNVAKLNFRLKAVIGWAVPPGGSLSTTDLKNTIYNSYISLQLTPTVHSFDFDDLGRVTFTIPYLAYVEDFFDSPQFNIFTDEQTVKNLISRETKFEALNKLCDEKSRSKVTEEEAESIQKQIKEDKESLFSDLMTKAIKNGVVRYAPLKYEDIKNFNQMGPYFKYDYEGTIAVADESMAAEIIGDAEEKPTAVVVPEFKLTDSRGKREASIYKSPSQFPSRIGPK
jgi:hypothetical protein